MDYARFASAAASARVLFADPDAVEGWLVDELLEHASTRRAVRAMPWSEIGREAYTAAAKRNAKRTSIALRPLFPNARGFRAFFAAVVDAVERRAAPRIAYAMDPQIGRLPPFQQSAYAEALLLRALATLFEGALVEAGAVALPSIGEACCVFELDGERVTAPGSRRMR